MALDYALPEQFETTRYQLRRLKISDANAIFESYASDPEVTKYLGFQTHQTIADTARFLKIVHDEWATKTGFAFAIAQHSNPEHFLGVIHVHLGNHGISYGYALRQSAWGQGCASETLAALVEHALACDFVYRAYAFCDIENTASARVMEKAGMKREAVLKRYFMHPNISNTPRDCLVYAITK